MEKTQQNILIAEFMGRKFEPRNGNSIKCIQFDTYKQCEDWIKTEYGAEGYVPLLVNWDHLGLYHKSWDWLMPVVEKINNLKNGSYAININSSCAFLHRWNEPLVRLDIETYGYIGMVYEAVIQFIEWYNTNN